MVIYKVLPRLRVTYTIVYCQFLYQLLNPRKQGTIAFVPLRLGYGVVTGLSRIPYQWFASFSFHQHHPGGLARSLPRVFYLVGQGQGLKIYITNTFSGDAILLIHGLHFENHCLILQNNQELGRMKKERRKREIAYRHWK